MGAMRRIIDDAVLAALSVAGKPVGTPAAEDTCTGDCAVQVRAPLRAQDSAVALFWEAMLD